jgi:hypothetical protein
MLDRRLSKPLSKWAAVLGAAVVWVISSAPTAWALVKAEAMTLDYQVQHSDVILRGTCVDTTTGFINKHIVTTYKIAVKKYIKAPGKMSVESKPVIFVSQVGGRVSIPLPIEESYPEMAALYSGEEVILFLQSPESTPAGVRAKYDQYVAEGRLKPSPLMSNYQLTTLNISKLTVVKDAKTGAEVVTRIALDRFGVLPSEEAVKSYVKALESQTRFITVKRGNQTVQIPVQVGKPVSGEGATAPGGATPRIEEKIRQMQGFTTTWESFQQQVEGIMRGEKSSTPSPVGGTSSAQPTRTFQPRKDQ